MDEKQYELDINILINKIGSFIQKKHKGKDVSIVVSSLTALLVFYAKMNKTSKEQLIDAFEFYFKQENKEM